MQIIIASKNSVYPRIEISVNRQKIL